MAGVEQVQEFRFSGGLLVPLLAVCLACADVMHSGDAYPIQTGYLLEGAGGGADRSDFFSGQAVFYLGHGLRTGQVSPRSACLEVVDHHVVDAKTLRNRAVGFSVGQRLQGLDCLGLREPGATPAIFGAVEGIFAGGSPREIAQAVVSFGIVQVPAMGSRVWARSHEGEQHKYVHGNGCFDSCFVFEVDDTVALAVLPGAQHGGGGRDVPIAVVTTHVALVRRLVMRVPGDRGPAFWRCGLHCATRVSWQ